MDIGEFLNGDQHRRSHRRAVLHRACSCWASPRGRSAGHRHRRRSSSRSSSPPISREPLGNFLGANWTQFPTQYSYMVGFGTVFVAATIAFALVIQGFYKPQPLFEKARFVDELIGGVLGVIQAAIILGAIVIILDSFFRDPRHPQVTQRAALPARPVATPSTRPRSSGSSARPSSRAFLTVIGLPRARRRSRRALPDAELTVLDRGSLAGRRSRPRARCSERAWSAMTATGRRVGRIVEVEAYIGPGRSGVACPVRPDGAQPGHVRAAGHRLRVPCLRDV